LPWNFPLSQGCARLAMLLAAGNAGIFKGSELAQPPLLALEELAREAELPDWAFSVVTGGPEIGQMLVESALIDAVCFTGGIGTGLAVAQAAARSLKRLILELGGKTPFAVFADADLDTAMDVALAAGFGFQGQACNAGSLLLVQEPVYAGPEAEAMRVLLEPDVDLTVPPGLDLALITPEVLRDYELATTSFGVFSRGLEPAMDGSNNWAISGRRTASGRPILANDPHRAVEVPSLRYLAHIVCPALDIIGGGEPALPGISIGHNGQVAFGLTVLPVDQEDLYVYETDGPGGSCYRYREGWEAMEIVSETIPVRGGKSVDVALKFTRHGPVVAELPAKCAAFSVRAAWLQPGMAPYVAGIGLMQAHDLDEFRTAARGWGAPGENLLYADVKNNIAWQPAALVPVRPNWDGLLPVPGDGRYEWAGFITTADLPVEVNPARGWLATANQRNIDPDQIGGVRVGFEWEPPFRFQRIQDVLEQDRLLTVEESAALQNDYLSLAARHLHKTLASLQCTDERAARGAVMLAEWDLHLEARSAAAALFEVWFRSHLRPALFAEVLAEQVPAGKLGRALESLVNHANVTGDARIDLALIDHVESSPRTARQLDRIFESTLAAAMRHLEDLLGPDSTVWQWGALHQVKIEHPLTHELNAVTDLNRHGAQPRGGCGDTVGNTSYGTASFAQTWGATLRMVLDVGEWDNSLAMNSPWAIR
jgi:penicillin amidase